MTAVTYSSQMSSPTSATNSSKISLPPSPTTTSPSPSSLTVNALVIDDNIITGKILSKILEKEFGHHVTCLESGEAALEALSKDLFDICFLDIDMPGINGMETTLAIRRQAGVNNLNNNCAIVSNGVAGCGATTGTPVSSTVSASALAAANAAASKVLEQNRSIPIIAYTTNEWSQRFMDVGMNGFLAKPATLDSLRSELERIF
ncbi:8000_t:CDS:1 [Ambispora leptoticha]|uniref:8000_t:CDS:1 n=1 Tax=Ambispora leptoticha TaxID=144679 RepID=A0A9N8WNH1_9GLOM|nr:8000_t:CDS:1 [Ambispora leptoticha]